MKRTISLFIYHIARSQHQTFEHQTFGKFQKSQKVKFRSWAKPKTQLSFYFSFFFGDRIFRSVNVQEQNTDATVKVDYESFKNLFEQSTLICILIILEHFWIYKYTLAQSSG